MFSSSFGENLSQTQKLFCFLYVRSGTMSSEVSAMLLQFRVKNYKSIGEEIVIDLTAGRGQEHPNFLIDQNGVKVLPVISLYGANASGKSNVVEAIVTMFENITFSTTYRGEKDNPLTIPFLFDANLSSEPTEMEMFIALGETEYQYGYVVNRHSVIEEWLYYRKLSKNKTKNYIIFERTNSEISFGSKFEKLAVYSDFITNKFLALSFLGNLNNEKNPEYTQIFNNIFSWARDNAIWPRAGVINPALLMMKRDSLQTFNDSILQFVQEFDPCIEKLKIEKEVNSTGNTSYRVLTQHNGTLYPIEIESTGTKKLIELYLTLFISLNRRQTTLVFDELDTYLHPLIIRRIVAMFHNKEVNKMNSQLITTSHNLITMDKNELRRDQIWFVEKDDRGFTNAYSLASFKSTEEEIRSDMVYGKHYLYGRFGAIPYTNIKGCK